MRGRGRLKVATFAVAVALITLLPRGSARVASDLTRPEPAARLPASVAPATPPAPVVPQPSVSGRVDYTYFDRELLGRKVVSDLYHSVKDKLPAGEASELAAVFIAEGPVRNGTPEFAEFMSQLLADVRAHSPELLDLLTTQDAALKQDPFVYQMALNLAFQLTLPPEQKAQALGGAMGIHFQRDARTGVTLMTANITNALILMKNSGVTLAQALPYIQKGVQTNRDDPDALKEFAARANTYYPGSVPGY